jgi:hypothetical protein
MFDPYPHKADLYKQGELDPSPARLKIKSLNLHICIRKRNIMDLPKRKKVREKRNYIRNKGFNPCCKKC